MSLSNIPVYNIRRSGTGPTTGIWQYKVGSGNFTDIGSAITWGSITTSSGNDQSAITLSGISALQNIPSGISVTFRIVSWAGASAGTWYINDQMTGSRDLIVNGTVVSTDATLSNLSTSAGALTPTFSSSTTGYTAPNVSNATTSITVTPTVNQGNATITVNGSVATSGSASTVNLSVGSNSIPVVITAQDGSTKKTYTITVIRNNNQSTASYQTFADGNFSNGSVWQWNDYSTHYTADGSVPASTNNVLIQNNVLLDQNFTNGSGTTFTIASTPLSPNTTDTLNVAATYTLTLSGTATFNGKHVTIKSTSAGTGSIGVIASPANVTGLTNVTAERYIPVNTTSPRTGRAWRLLTAPLASTSTTTINTAWQEGEVYDGTNNYITGTSTVVTPAAGYGTLITGQQQGSAATANSNGYDYWSAISNASTSILRYAQGTPYGSWAVLPNGTRTNALSTEPGYLLYVRGDRTVSTASTGSATTLRATGTVNQGTQSITVAGSSTAGFTLIGNPFASTINFETIYTNNSSKIQNYFYVWDANLNTLGGYILVTRNSANNYTAVPASGSDGNVTSANAQYIQSGQAFFVIPTGTTGTTLTIQESDKTTSNNNNVLFLPKNVSPVTTLNINLNLFNSDSSVLLADGALVKFTSGPKKQVAANISKAYNFLENLSLYQDTNYLIVGGYKMPTAKDTIHLKLWGTSQRSYQLSFEANNADSLTVKAYLFDSYTGILNPVKLTGDTSNINFSVTSDAASQSIDRFCIVFKKDKTQTATDITQTQPTEDKSIVELKAYPNPVQSSSFTLSVNSLAAGRYTISMYSPAGKMLQTQEADHKGGALSQSVNIPKGWVNGHYQVSISNEKGEIIKTVPVILGRF